MRIHVQHIGVVVRSIDETLDRLQRQFGAREVGVRRSSGAGERSALVEVGSDTYYLLMEPVREHGIVSEFYQNNGQGLHHVNVLVEDLDAFCKNYESHGRTLVGKSVGDGKHRGLSLPEETGGVLYVFTDMADRDAYQMNKEETIS